MSKETTSIEEITKIQSEAQSPAYGSAEGSANELSNLTPVSNTTEPITDVVTEQKYKFVILLADFIPIIDDYYVIDKASSIIISTSNTSYEEYINALRGKVDSRTTFIIANHGTSFNNPLIKGTYGLLWNEPQSIKNILEKTVLSLVGNKPVEVHLTSCYGADDTSVVNVLGRGSVILFYTTPGNSTEIKTSFGGIPYLSNKRSEHQDTDILNYKRILDTIHTHENDITVAINAEPNAYHLLEDYTIVASTRGTDYSYDELAIITKQNRQKLYDFLSSYKLSDISGISLPNTFDPTCPEQDIRELITISTFHNATIPKDRTLANTQKFIRKIPEKFLPTKNIEEYLHLKLESEEDYISPSIVDLMLSDSEQALYFLGTLIDEERNIEDFFLNKGLISSLSYFTLNHFNNLILSIQKLGVGQETIKNYVHKFDNIIHTKIDPSNHEDVIKFVEIIHSLDIDLYDFLSKNWIACGNILQVLADNKRPNPFEPEATKELLLHSYDSLIKSIVKIGTDLESMISENDDYFLFESISKSCTEFNIENPYITSGKIIKILESLIADYYISISRISFIDSLNVDYSQLSREKAQVILGYDSSDIETIKAKVSQYFSIPESEYRTLAGEIIDTEAIE